MSFIKESYIAYKKVQEAEDHEISMARGELEAIADKATQLASMLQGKSDEGNPLEAWVQSKITKAKDYINSVSDYMMYNPDMKQNEELQLEESTFEKIYQMQQDGKSLDDIAKELKLKPELVKKVLGESKEISEGLSDAQIAQLKKEYEPLKGKTITTSQYQQLKNILFKLQDGDLEKLQKQNIPFASTGAGSILRVRKSPVKITSVKVPGLEGMAEESDKKLPKDLEDLDKKSKEVEKKFRDSLKIPTKNEEVEESFKDNIIKKLVKPIKDYNKKKEEPKKEEVSKEKETEFHKKLDTLVHKTFGKRKDEKMPIKESHFDVNTQVLYKGQKAQIIQLKEPQVGNYYVVKLDSGENVEASYQDLSIDEACWVGYKQVGLKKKGKRMVPNCVKEDKRLYIESIVAVKNKAEKSGMPYPVLKQVYDRGMAAWKGGHRPGATQVQWALARVNSFITKSSGTWGGADSDLAKKVKG